MKSLFIFFQHLAPQHLLSRLAGKLADASTPALKNFMIRKFVKRYGVNMAEAINSEAEDFATFNDFFTRALKPGTREVHSAPDSLVSPADGIISAAGNITGDQLFQAKGKSFSLAALLGGDSDTASSFLDGSFVTVYLSPKDYHRVHMPCAGILKKMIYVPGKLFSVNQTTSERIDDLFARNERAVCLFDTDAGPMAMILVGAMIVAGIETVWSGQVAPAPHGLCTSDYANQHPAIQLAKGEEMGRFKLGSTVILLTGPGAVNWLQDVDENFAVKMGEQIGDIKK
ncbi:MAG: phosphatidylserine decarboxylase [Gammaproteobacteria bacterium]|jgi:phosphatidylserine decarboxylase|nr:phosphatidylserine decarboxylase [Gammaproteobacteria bacterium]MBT6042708.1 phosphatidylserine decarboxylase [Gammaproteobacteria bacterium]